MASHITPTWRWHSLHNSRPAASPPALGWESAGSEGWFQSHLRPHQLCKLNRWYHLISRLFIHKMLIAITACLTELSKFSNGIKICSNYDVRLSMISRSLPHFIFFFWTFHSESYTCTSQRKWRFDSWEKPVIFSNHIESEYFSEK